MIKNALGKGLEALIPDSRLEELERHNQYIPVEQISSYDLQPRQFFNEAALEELAASIRQHGIIQPLVVTRVPEGYQLIAGERRLRAAKLAGLREVPAIITNIAKEQQLEVSLIENIQREDLNPVEEAVAYQNMQDRLGLTQEEISQRVGKERSTVANFMRLLKLPSEIKQCLIEGQLTMGHARAVLALSSQQQQLEVCQRIIQRQLSVRDAERLVQRQEQPPKSKPAPEVWLQEAEDKLKRALSTKVKISLQQQKSKSSPRKGKIEIEFYSEDELGRLMEILTYRRSTC